MMKWMLFAIFIFDAFATDTVIFNQAIWLGEWTCFDNAAFVTALLDAGAINAVKAELVKKKILKFTFEAWGDNGFCITNQEGIKHDGVTHGATGHAPKTKLFKGGDVMVTFEEGNVITIVITNDKYVVTVKRFDNDGITHKMHFKFEGKKNGKASECILIMNKTG